VLKKGSGRVKENLLLSNICCLVVDYVIKIITDHTKKHLLI